MIESGAYVPYQPNLVDIAEVSPECSTPLRTRQEKGKDISASGNQRVNMSFKPPGQQPNRTGDVASEEGRSGAGAGRTRDSPYPSATVCAATKPTGHLQLRSACDACHQSKIKCPGGYPCFPCQSSRSRCNYSPGSRLGRPKGSKNKRTLMREGLENGNLQRSRGQSQSQTGSSAQEYDSSMNSGRNNEAAMQWTNRGHQQRQPQQQQQQQLDQQLLPAAAMYQMDFEVEFDQGFHTAAAGGDTEDEDHTRDSHSDILRMLDPDLALNSTGGDASNLSHPVHTSLAPQMNVRTST